MTLDTGQQTPFFLSTSPLDKCHSNFGCPKVKLTGPENEQVKKKRSGKTNLQRTIKIDV